MLRLKPTRLTFRQEDLKEYETEKAKWAEEKSKSEQEQSSSKSGDGVLPSSVDDRRSTIHDRIGLGGGSKK
jgi:hypothetical protein